MRMLHAFESEKDAERFSEALYGDSIGASLRESKDGSFHVWVENDDDLDAAKAILEVFLKDPNDARFSKLKESASALRKKEKVREKKSRHRVMKARDTFKADGMGPITIAVIGICACIAFVTELGDDRAAVQHFWFASVPILQGGVFYTKTAWLVATWENGEVWRILSPAFVHLSIFHILFNLWWWKDLAASLERVHSSLWLVCFFVVTHLAGAFPQFYFGGVYFGGLSGVVYGLFGYIWIRGRYDPAFPLALPKTTVMWMLGFYVLCFAGFMPVANWGHSGGLVVGALWGFLNSGHIRRRWLRKNQ
ncbi:MAG: rhomboid family intramembrane serine protease [Polyangiales bacterium]